MNNTRPTLIAISLACFLSLSGCSSHVAPQKNEESPYDQFLDKADDELVAKQDKLTKDYHLRSYHDFHWSQNDGQLIFSNNGKPGVIADMQFVGDVSCSSKTWLWSWANASIDKRLTHASSVARDYGIANHYDKLSTAEWKADQVDGWDMTAITAKLTNAVGAYRSPYSPGYDFLIITDIRWAGRKH